MLLPNYYTNLSALLHVAKGEYRPKLAARGQLLLGLTPLMDTLKNVRRVKSNPLTTFLLDAPTNHNLWRNDPLGNRRTLLLWVE